jgi:nucleotide-binding universal stress UspA family protein
MTTILAPLDNSAEAKTALPYAMALATPGTEILLLTVVANGDEAEAAAAMLEQVAQRMRVVGRTVRTEVAVGDPVEQILGTASNPGMSIIVLASHGRGAVGRLIYGSVADRIGRESTVPVMVVRAARVEPGPVGITRLVVPLDGSPFAEQSLPIATEISRRLGTSIYLVRAVNALGLIPPAIGFGEAIPPQIYDEAEEQMEQEARDYLDGIAQSLRDQGLPVVARVLNGPPATAIMEATQLGDVVVLCSHEQTGVMRWLLGSVAEQLTREDQSPVILVPATEPEPAAAEPAGLGG